MMLSTILKCHIVLDSAMCDVTRGLILNCFGWLVNITSGGEIRAG